MKRFAQYLTFAILVGLIVLGVTQAQYIRDSIKLHGYQPSAEVKRLASDTTMTSKAERIFYVNHPNVAERTSFRSFCGTNREQTIVLGCYHGNQNGIYVLDVTDERLTGVEQVTAAHEMLHAVYDRMSTKQKTAINAQLEDYYNNQLSDERIKKTIDSYKISEPNDVVNEMHSIFGTEVADLPAGLESYYEQYFKDRQAVVKKAAAYESEFSSRRAEIAADDTQLTDWKKQIDSLQTQISRDGSAIETQRTQLNTYRSSGNTSAYNAGVPGYNNSVNNYNDQLASLRSLIAKYNQLVQDRNQLASQIDTLVEAISSSDIPDNQ